MTVETLIADRRLGIVLEPVISIRQKTAVGREARLSGPDPAAAAELRRLAANQGWAVELDRWYRREALSAFRSAGSPGLLFLGFETAVLDMGVAGSGHLAGLVQENLLDPAQVVISIRESRVEDAAALEAFVGRHRKQGFLIALKELGEGHSNLERLAQVRPDVIKIGAGLIRRFEREFVAQEILRSLGSLARKAGALLAAEGVGDEAQALAALDHGVDMLQGPFLGAAGEDPAGSIDALAARHRSFTVERSKATQGRLRELENLLASLVRGLAAVPPADFDGVLARLGSENPAVECLFVLSASGIQETETHIRPGVAFKRNALFHPARPGADHSMKEYVYLLSDEVVSRFRTDPYVSLASGNLCVTLSASFRDASNRTHILCLDAPWDNR